MQLRTICDQSVSRGLTSMCGWRTAGSTASPACTWPGASGGLGAPDFGVSPSRFRRDGLAGDASPITLQLNVPTHCIGGLTQILSIWFRQTREVQGVWLRNGTGAPGLPFETWESEPP